MQRLSLEDAQRLVRASGSKIRVKTVRVNQYVWKCPDRHCPKSRLEGAIKGTVINWVILNAGLHLQGAQKRKARARLEAESRKTLMTV